MRGTSASPAAMQAGEALGSLIFAGASGASGNYIEGASIWGITSENFSAGAGGTSMAFYTTPNGSAASQIRLWLDQSGNVGIGTKTPAYTLQVNGIIAPGADALFDLGAATLRFKNIYASNGLIQTSDLHYGVIAQEMDQAIVSRDLNLKMPASNQNSKPSKPGFVIETPVRLFAIEAETEWAL